LRGDDDDDAAPAAAARTGVEAMSRSSDETALIAAARGAAASAAQRQRGRACEKEVERRACADDGQLALRSQSALQVYARSRGAKGVSADAGGVRGR
jgi:hypothetical protein